MAADSEASPFARAAIITVGVLVLYVLSIGPVWRYTRGFSNDPRWPRAIYFPLEFAMDKSRPVGVVLSWYFELWDSGSTRY